MMTYFDNSTIAQPDLHQNASAGRKGIANHGGENHIASVVPMDADNLAAADETATFKANKAGWIDGVTVVADDLDTGALLTFDVGIDGGAEFLNDSTIGQAGGSAISSAGRTAIAKDSEITITIVAAPAGVTEGNIEVQFNYATAV